MSDMICDIESDMTCDIESDMICDTALCDMIRDTVIGYQHTCCCVNH